ncbi:uncharacterized protein LOC103184171 [Callorhinchus milii]|uniref:uncharacterized protein LOC103184171 n=1 Tax=Callorhinchus milii TaxID=7868 RepID=UPI001C3F9ABA|nr:uncharacterized protein LOC103184171 [Callorhinchus milii]
MCEVQDNGSTVLTADMDFEVYTFTVDTGTGGVSTNLICSVSEVTETVRLVWMGNDSKTFITEKTLKAEIQEEKSLSLSVQGADGGTWTCVLFHQNSPRVIIPYYLEPSENKGSSNISIFLYVSVLMVLFFILLVSVVLVVIKLKASGSANKRQEVQQQGEYLDDGSLLYSNVQYVQASKSATNSSNFDEYATLSQREPKPSANAETHNPAEMKSEEIHYASVTFQVKSGSNSKKRFNSEEPSANFGTSDEEPCVIYASVTNGTQD